MHGNHRVLRNRRVAARSGIATTLGSGAMASAMSKLGATLSFSSKMARSNALRISAAAFLVGSYKLIEKYGDNDVSAEASETR